MIFRFNNGRQILAWVTIIITFFGIIGAVAVQWEKINRNSERIERLEGDHDIIIEMRQDIKWIKKHLETSMEDN